MRIFCVLIGEFLLVHSFLSGALPQNNSKRSDQISLRNDDIPQKSAISKMEIALFKLINDQRIKHRLKSLNNSTILSSLAKLHSTNMAQGLVDFGHDGFEDRAREIKSYELHMAFGENVAYFHHVENPLGAAIHGWMNSQHHRENILGDFDETGIGIAYDIQGKCYITQLFAKKRS